VVKILYVASADDTIYIVDNLITIYTGD
jgi:hypothetical protein